MAGEEAWLRVAEKMAMRYISRGGKGKGRMCEMSVIGKGLLRCVEVVGGDWGVGAMRRLLCSVPREAGLELVSAK